MSKISISTSFSAEKPGQSKAYIIGRKVYPPKCHWINTKLRGDLRPGATVESRECTVCGTHVGVAWAGHPEPLESVA